VNRSADSRVAPASGRPSDGEAGRRPALHGARYGIPLLLALTAALIRLIPLHWLHPLNWDEIEFFRATSWIAEGRLPYRDFWEHHTPLMWFLFAPFTLLTNSPGVDAIVLMRWAQIPVWVATFWLASLWMRGAGIECTARWVAMAFALCSSLFMLPAIEYRVDSLGCMLVMAGLVLAQRQRFVLAGVAFCLAVFANLRLGPVLVVAVLALIVRHRTRGLRIIAGGVAALAACLTLIAANGFLRELIQQVWRDNLGERFATPVIGAFVHRLLVPFGVRIMATDRLFEWAAVDAGGIVILLFGFAGMLVAWKLRGDLLLLAVIQLANLAFIASMKFIYNYHFALVVILAIPLVAAIIERIPRRGFVTALLVLAWLVNAFASIFRGKELDRAYQNIVMHEVHARTMPGEKVWSGVPWAFRREPAYRFWFMPELARQLVRQNLAPRFALNPNDPPAAIVFDHYTLVWVVTVQRELVPYIVRHYMPVWRNLWIPAMNARVRPGQRVEWIVPRDGDYRLYASPELARHPWFRDPLGVIAYKAPVETKLRGMTNPPLTVSLSDGAAAASAVDVSRGAMLRKGQHVSVTSRAGEPLGVILIAGNDYALFKQPPPGVTLEAETTRITHVPRLR
jgi:hypothetical protein